MKTDQQVIREKDDLEFLKRPNLWPLWPIVPLKKYSDNDVMPETALALLDNKYERGGKLRLYTGVTANLLLFNSTMPHVMKTPEEIVALGWKVD